MTRAGVGHKPPRRQAELSVRISRWSQVHARLGVPAHLLPGWTPWTNNQAKSNGKTRLRQSLPAHLQAQPPHRNTHRELTMQRILIIGAGFAGMYAAQSAARLRDLHGVSSNELEIALISP